MKSKLVGLRVPPESLTQLTKEAKANGYTLSGYLRHCIQLGRAKLAAKGLIKKGG